MRRRTMMLFIGVMLILSTSCGGKWNEDRSDRIAATREAVAVDSGQEAAYYPASLLADEEEGAGTELVLQEVAQARKNDDELQLKQEQFLLARMHEERVQRDRGTLRPATSEDREFLNMFSELETNILDVIVPEAENRALGGEGVPFQQLEPLLLTYMTENALELWAHVYEKNPGWIMEPDGLVHTRAGMYEPSFRAEKQSDVSMEATFKTYGSMSYGLAKHMKVTFLWCEDNEAWRIDTIESEPLEYGYTLQEVKAIMEDAGEAVAYEGADQDNYYFKSLENKKVSWLYVFNKREGMYDITTIPTKGLLE